MEILVILAAIVAVLVTSKKKTKKTVMCENAVRVTMFVKCDHAEYRQIVYVFDKDMTFRDLIPKYIKGCTVSHVCWLKCDGVSVSDLTTKIWDIASEAKYPWNDNECGRVLHASFCIYAE